MPKQKPIEFAGGKPRVAVACQVLTETPSPCHELPVLIIADLSWKARPRPPNEAPQSPEGNTVENEKPLPVMEVEVFRGERAVICV